jgi:hypothetical protein
MVDSKSSKSGTFFIHGEPGTGKSLLTLLLAKQIGAHYCDTWKPTDPGDTLSQVYSTIAPDEETPLVLVLEECDKILFDVLDGKLCNTNKFSSRLERKATGTECWTRSPIWGFTLI